MELIIPPPSIAPVPPGTARPLWSVMIPSYNCAAYLRKTLASVLAQDPGPDQMQIEVIDDCSTKDDPEAVVRELSPDGRITFHRHPANVGAIANFNACIERSRGHLVHILHGDDTVLPGFYPTVEHLAKTNPDAALIATRALIIDEQGVVRELSHELPAEGHLAPVDDFYYSNPFVTPTVVLRRSFYECHGGFDPSFPHVADWDMWLRALRLGGGVACPQLLASYRVHQSNDTGRLARTAGNLEDCLRFYVREAGNRPSLDLRRMRYQLGTTAFWQAGRFLAPADRFAFVTNRRFFWRMMGRRAGLLYWASDWFGRRLRERAARRVPATVPTLADGHP